MKLILSFDRLKFITKLCLSETFGFLKRFLSVSFPPSFQECGHKAAFCHGSMDPPQRALIQKQWSKDEINIICATVAFGMGTIDYYYFTALVADDGHVLTITRLIVGLQEIFFVSMLQGIIFLDLQ